MRGLERHCHCEMRSVRRALRFSFSAGSMWTIGLLIVLLAVVVMKSAGCSGLTTTTPRPPTPPPTATLTPSATSLNFGQARVGTTSTTQSLTLTNSGNSAITVNAVTTSVPFAVSGFNGTTTLNAGQTLSLTVNFTPFAPGPASATLSVTTSPTSASLAVPLSGAGQAPIIAANPSSLNFGNQTVGTTTSQSLTVSNQGQLTLSLNQVSVNPSVFLLAGPTPPMSISPGSSVSYSVTFNPSGTQSYTGSVTFTSDAFNGTVSTSLSGTGVAATTALNVSPGMLNFGNQVVNTASPQQTVTLTNAGSTSITISAVQASAPFTVSGFSTLTTLTAGQSLAVALAFTPIAQTSYNGTLTITSTAPSSPNTVGLSGTGISPPNVDLTPPNCGLTNDISNHIPNAANWGAWMPPAQGGTYQDTELSSNACVIKRLTNSVNDNLTNLHYYATIEPMSLNDTKIIDVGGAYRIIDLNGSVVVTSGNMPAHNGGPGFQWDRADDSKFWTTSGNVLERCTVSGSTTSCVSNHTFTEYSYMVNFMDETDETTDGWFAIVGQNTQGSTIDVFMFKPDLTGGTNYTKAPVFTTPCSADINGPNNGCLHKLISTPLNGVAISGSAAVGGSGYALWESPWSGLQGITDVGHFDSAKDLSGKEILFCENGGSGANFNPCIISMGSSDFGAISSLFVTPPLSGWHISSRDYPQRPWGVYSAQIGPNGSTAEFFVGAGYVGPSSSNWKAFQNEVVMVRVDNNNGSANLYRLTWTHARTMAGGDFWQDPRAAISWDGKYIVFESAAAFASSGCGSIADCADMYLIGPLF